MGPIGVELAFQKASGFGLSNVELLGESLGRIADTSKPGVEIIEAGGDRFLDDLAGHAAGPHAERIGESAVQMFRDLQRRVQLLG